MRLGQSIELMLEPDTGSLVALACRSRQYRATSAPTHGAHLVTAADRGARRDLACLATRRPPRLGFVFSIAEESASQRALHEVGSCTSRQCPTGTKDEKKLGRGRVAARTRGEATCSAGPSPAALDSRYRSGALHAVQP